MINDYIKLFEKRGKTYDDAMQLYPNTRDEEFLQAIEEVVIQSGFVIADIPAGGNYLKHLLPTDSVYFPYEPCGSFDENNYQTTENLLPIPIDDNKIDIAFSIAGVHHLEDKTELFHDIHRIVKKGGRFILSDVQAGSSVALFLDTYVGKYNSTGHKGIFLNQNTLDELTKAGWKIEKMKSKKFHWVFDDRVSMGIFCNKLFDICDATEEQTIKEIENTLGVTIEDDTTVGMNWELLTIVAIKE